MNKIKIGVFGAGRGASMMRYCEQTEGVVLVAICDKNKIFLDKVRAEFNDPLVSYYENFDDFIKHDMDAVVLANYANEHAEFAIKCLDSGKHVLSEVLPFQTMSQAVRLVEAYERSGKEYVYAENYCYMAGPKEMRKLYKEGKLGEFEYGEGEYMHDCEGLWPEITQGNPEHWRNTTFASFYCTHSMGPLLHITGLRPKQVVGIELPNNEKCKRMGAKYGSSALEIVTLNNGATVKSLHGLGCSRNSIWYSIYGTKGRMETQREDAVERVEGAKNGFSRLFVNIDGKDRYDYYPEDEYSEKARGYGHGEADFYVMFNFIKKISGDNDCDIVDVYEAADMFMPGLFAHFSVLAGGVTMDIPDLRDKASRERYRNDNRCTIASVAGDQVVPMYSKGNVDIPAEVYENIKNKWLESLKK